jgi:hypothetical protein
MKPADRVNQFPQLSSMGIVGGTVDQTIEQNLLYWSFSSLSWSSLVFEFPFRETSLVRSVLNGGSDTHDG